MSILSKLLGRSSGTPPTDLPVKGEGETSEAGFMHFKDSPIVGEGRIDSGLSTASAEVSDQTTVADSFGFGVEREMKESGEKGGTEDIRVGVGELQETVVSKPMDAGADGGVFVASREADTAAPARVVKEWDASSPGLMQDEDSEGSTLAALEVQEPEAIGPAAGAASEEPVEADDFDLDLEDDGDIDA